MPTETEAARGLATAGFTVHHYCLASYSGNSVNVGRKDRWKEERKDGWMDDWKGVKEGRRNGSVEGVGNWKAGWMEG